MQSLEEELTRELRAIADEADSQAGTRVADKVMATVTSPPHGGTLWRRAAVIIAAGVGAAAAATAVFSGWGESAPERSQPPVVDCALALAYSSNTYVMLMGSNVGTVAPGDLLGTGTYGQCADATGDEPVERDVYEMPGVPSSQAILVTDSEGRGYVYLNTQAPSVGWDSDLQSLFDQWNVRL
jgi:hypothetical protein